MSFGYGRWSEISKYFNLKNGNNRSKTNLEI